MTRLPPILAFDYFRNAVWPQIQLYGALVFLTLIIVGVL